MHIYLYLNQGNSLTNTVEQIGANNFTKEGKKKKRKS